MSATGFFLWYGLNGKLATATMSNGKEYWGKMKAVYKNAIIFNERCTDDKGVKFIRQVILNPYQIVSYELDEMLMIKSTDGKKQEDQHEEQELKLKDEMGSF